jgi:hypothetical protein
MGQLNLSICSIGDRSLNIFSSSGYFPPSNPSRYLDSNLCVSRANAVRSPIPYNEQPALNTSRNANAPNVVYPPALPPSIHNRFASASPSLTKYCAPLHTSSISTIPQLLRNRRRYARPYPVEPP